MRYIKMAGPVLCGLTLLFMLAQCGGRKTVPYQIFFANSPELPSRWPFVQATLADSAVIVWNTGRRAIVSNAAVLLGSTQDSLAQQRTGRWDTLAYGPHEIRHQYTLKGLRPATTYQYAIKLQQGNGTDTLLQHKDWYFTTPPANDTTTIRFFAVGDIGEPVEEGGFPAVTARQMAQWPDPIMFGLGLGDIVYPDGESEDYQEHFFNQWNSLLANVTFFPAPGNHDWHVDPTQNFTKEWVLPGNEQYYAFSYGNALFVALDSRDGDFYERNAQKAWLENTLKTQGPAHQWVFLYLHHNGRSCTYKKNYQHVINMYPTFAQLGVDFVFNGHAHTYERLHPYNGQGQVIESLRQINGAFPAINNGFISITAGAGGKLKTSWSPGPCNEGNIVAKAHHDNGSFMVIEITGPRLQLWAIDSQTGQVVDSLSMDKTL